MVLTNRGLFLCRRPQSTRRATVHVTRACICGVRSLARHTYSYSCTSRFTGPTWLNLTLQTTLASMILPRTHRTGHCEFKAPSDQPRVRESSSSERWTGLESTSILILVDSETGASRSVPTATRSLPVALSLALFNHHSRYCMTRQSIHEAARSKHSPHGHSRPQERLLCSNLCAIDI